MRCHYDLELERLQEKLDKGSYEKVLLQFPDGLKMYANEVVDALRKAYPEIHFLIYFGSCYGGCDIPTIPGIDLMVQWGHVKFLKQRW